MTSNGFHFLPILAEAQGTAALVTFAIYMVFVMMIAVAANRLLSSKSFMSEYFLGSRSLGVWAFALTYAATSASGGSFTGFPSKIYTHGWVLALWIGSYMVVPICTMGLLGKRLNQVARLSGSITVPDVIRDRFHSRTLGLMAVVLIVFFMSINMIAQFKAGSLILGTLLDGVDAYEFGAKFVAQSISGYSFLDGVSGEYLICLLVFGLAVVIYTTYGGFHAVVWTDVMQGVVMVLGVVIMLPLTIGQVGGLESATKEMAKMVPPRYGTAVIERSGPLNEERRLQVGRWLLVSEEGRDQPRVMRVREAGFFAAGESTLPAKVLEIVTSGDIERVLQRQSELLADDDLSVVEATFDDYAYGGDVDNPQGVYVTGPGPSLSSQVGFLPLSLAISFFFMWAISGTGQPGHMVRLMAFKDSKTLTRAIMMVAIYYTMIYFPLVMIFCCARIILPGMEVESDRIMPAMALRLSTDAGVPWLAGLLVAAPFAAVMSTVDSYLLMISSAIVRDIYQRNINPEASDKTVKRLSYFCTLLIGVGAIIGAVNAPEFLQDIIVYVGSGLAACFLGPMVYALYWPRSNTEGTIAGMLGGFTAHLGMYVAGIFTNGSFFQPYQLFDFDPIIVGLAVSFVAGYVVTLITPAPPEEIVRKYFYKRTA